MIPKVIASVLLCASATMAFAQTDEASRWRVREIADDLTGTITLAQNTSIRIKSQYSDEAVLHLRCHGKRVDGYVYWGIKIGNDVGGDILPVMHSYRVDDDPMVRAVWTAGNTRTATFFTRDEKNLIDRLRSANELVIQIAPKGLTPITATFDVRGSDSATKAVLQACGKQIEDVGKDGIFGIRSQRIGAKAATDRAAPTGYVPENSWLFSASGNGAHALVNSQSGKSYVALDCRRGRSGIDLTLGAPEGWQANQPVSLTVDGRSFPMEIDGSDSDVFLSNDPAGGMSITREVMDALMSGSLIALDGSAAENMPAGGRYFSLRGSSAAIRKMLAHCGL